MWFLLFQGLLIGLKYKSKVDWQWRWVFLPTWLMLAWLFLMLGLFISGENG